MKSNQTIAIPARWNTDNLPLLHDKLAVVTGANSGLGYETTLGLARAGATVIMTARSLAKGQSAREQILREVPQAAERLRLMQLDLADLSFVRRFAEELLQGDAAHGLDLLINNAGVMALPYQKTADGFEMQFGTNHLGHFALTALLLPALESRPGARVVNVSSMAHRWGKINFDDLMRETSYSKWEAYGQSKVANLLFTFELQRRLAAAGSSVIAVAAHPGYSATNLQNAGPQMSGSNFTIALNNFANSLIAQSAAMGALPTLCAAAAPEVVGGDYIGPNGFREFWGHPAKVGSNSHSRDEAVAARLFAESEQLTGVQFALKATGVPTTAS